MRTASNQAHLLIVEGEGDRSLLEQLCRESNISTQILLTATPKDLLDNGFNTKQGAYLALEDRLDVLKRADSALKRVAIIVDADHTKEGQNFQTTFNAIQKRLNAFDYNFDQQASNACGGLVFAHQDAGFNPIGVWIMPNNQDDGAVESWISACINNTEQALFNHAQTTVSELSTIFQRTFIGNNLAKAQVATWLAWQKKPSIGLYAAVPLLNTQAELHQKLITWLRHIFPSS